MGRIHVLEKQVAELIAAGEVVDRPSSVVKELLENAVDAGSTAVTVEIQHGGVSYLRITDNGCGIAREDVPTAFLRHATSKVNSPEDLEGIGTLGFRGEALAAIAAVGALISMVGDLAASAIKRNYDIKDYGTLIPGHGGILDRFDSVIITAPIVYFLAATIL